MTLRTSVASPEPFHVLTKEVDLSSMSCERSVAPSISISPASFGREMLCAEALFRQHQAGFTADLMYTDDS